jgi:hypothetical protein
MSWKISTRGIPQSITGVAPTLDYRFAIDRNEIDAISLTDKLTYTGGNGTFTGSDGFIQPATTNVPRFDHDPLSRQSLGLLSEGSKENLLLRSEEFNQSWAATRASISPNVVFAPSGAATADKLAEDATASNSHFVAQSSLAFVSGLTYSFSVYAKSAERNELRLTFLSTAFGTAVAYNFNLSTVTAVQQTSGTNDTAEIVNVGSGWYRCRVSAQATASVSATVSILLLSSGQAIYTGDGTSGIFLWGAQLEAGSTPSTYIPTTTTAVTRTADSAVIDGTGILTGTYTMVEKPAGCAVVSGSNIELQPGFRAERIAVFPAALTNDQITAVRAAM